jgi:hypothetical protein
MNADREQVSECGGARFGNRDTVRRAVFATDIGDHRQDAILVHWNGPVCDGLLVEIGSVDRKSVSPEKPGSEGVNAGCLQLRTEVRNGRQKVASTKDEPRSVPGRALELLGLKELQEPSVIGSGECIRDSRESF